MSESQRASDDYRPDLDWIRVTAIVLVHFHHVGLMFAPGWWLIKSPITLPELSAPIWWAAQVRLPLLLLVSGVATTYALRKRTTKGVLGDRVKRLLVPLVFAVFMLSPPQIYIERLALGKMPMSYLEFYPSVFDFVPWPKGSLSWHHLWLIAYIFCYNLLMLPLFAWLKTEGGNAFRARIEAFLIRGVNIYLLFIPVGLNLYLLNKYPATMDLIHDPKTFIKYLIFFVYGYIFGLSPKLWDHLVEKRKPLTVVAVVASAVVIFPGSFPLFAEIMCTAFAAWAFILMVLAWAKKIITFTPAWLKYARERSFPVYMLHEVVLLLVAYPLLKLGWNTWVSLFVIGFGSLFLSFIGAEIVYRVPLLRPLFGLRFRNAPRAKQQAQSVPAAPAL